MIGYVYNCIWNVVSNYRFVKCVFYYKIKLLRYEWIILIYNKSIYFWKLNEWIWLNLIDLVIWNNLRI